MVLAVVALGDSQEPHSAKMCQTLKSCSVCLDDVSDFGARSTAKLECGHHFHLDCIGSAFNAKGAMQCPNCRHVENGRWLFANGSRWVEDFSIEEGDDEDYGNNSRWSDEANGFHWDMFSLEEHMHEEEDPMHEEADEDFGSGSHTDDDFPFEETEDDDLEYEAGEDDHEFLEAEQEAAAYEEAVEDDHEFLETEAEAAAYEEAERESERAYRFEYEDPDDELEYGEVDCETGEADHDFEYGEDDGEYEEPDYAMEHGEDDHEYEEADYQTMVNFMGGSDKATLSPLRNVFHTESPQRGGSSYQQGQSSPMFLDTIDRLVKDVIKDCQVPERISWFPPETMISELLETLKHRESLGASSSSPVIPDLNKDPRQSLGSKDSHLRPPGSNGPN